MDWRLALRRLEDGPRLRQAPALLSRVARRRWPLAHWALRSLATQRLRPDAAVRNGAVATGAGAWRQQLGLLSPEDSVSQNLAISACRDWRRAVSLLRGGRPDVVAQNAALGACGKERWAQAWRLLASSEAQALQLDVISYSCALRPLWLSAAGLLGALRRSLLRADVAALGAAMAGMGWRRALRWVRRMEEEALPANWRILGAAVGACAKGKRWAELLGLLRPAETPRWPTPVANAAVDGCEQAWPHALGVAAAMSWAKVEADVITRNAARAPAGLGQQVLASAPWASALAVASAAQLESVEGLGAVVRKAQRWERAEALLALMRPGGLEMSSVALNGARQHWAQLGLWRRALRGLGSDPVTFNVALFGAQRAEEWGTAAHLLQKLRSIALQPGLITHNTLLASLESRWQRCLGLETFACDDVGFNARLRACEQGSAWGQAQELLMGFLANGLEPKVITFSACVGACQRAQEWRRALRLARALEAAGLEPSLVTAACAVAAALCGQRFGQALRQLAALEASSAQSLRESQ
ncbi:unnamed protein product [Effrenium voratum]|uniref:Pentatricopeptide repeat-containing protein, chloroplastic n=1 Tax=Effrenium voratum TaxID=2562239 RepID=A0AA36IG95_9DINO|nr:unnamed protein product [Effrenium voratum]